MLWLHDRRQRGEEECKFGGQRLLHRTAGPYMRVTLRLCGPEACQSRSVDGAPILTTGNPLGSFS
jgi:hypothetical protein